MKILFPPEMLSDLACGSCREKPLSFIDTDAVKSICCNNCGRIFPCYDNQIDFLVQDFLDQTNLQEIEGNKYDFENLDIVEQMANKDKLGSVYSHSLMFAMNIVKKFLVNYSPDTTLYCLGSGTGFEIKALYTHEQFKRIYASDISSSALKVAMKVLEPFSGELGLIVSEFGHTPIQKGSDSLGLVFQALHHTADIHQAIDCLLKNNFTNLIIVEPTTNWLVEILAYFGLAKKIEYSGLRPSWMDLAKVEKIAISNKYNMQVCTWWEFPSNLIRFFEWNKTLEKITCQLLDFISRITGHFKFGSMSAVQAVVPQFWTMV